MHLDPEALALVRRMVAKVVPGVPVFIYGSRAHGRGLRPFSDLDLCLRGAIPTPKPAIAALREVLDDSSLPIRVDVADWYDLDPAFASRIESDFVPL